MKMKIRDSVGIALATLLIAVAMPGCSKPTPSFAKTIDGEKYSIKPSGSNAQMAYSPIVLKADAAESAPDFEFYVPTEYIKSHKTVKNNTVSYSDVLYDDNANSLLKVILGSQISASSAVSSSSQIAANAAFAVQRAETSSSDTTASGYWITYAKSDDSAAFNNFCADAEKHFAGTGASRSTVSDTTDLVIFSTNNNSLSLAKSKVSVTIYDTEAPTPSATSISIDFSKMASDYVSYSKNSPMYAKSFDNMTKAILENYTDNDVSDTSLMTVTYYTDAGRTVKVIDDDKAENGKSKFIDRFISSCQSMDSGKVTIRPTKIYYDVSDLTGNVTTGEALVTLKDDISPAVIDENGNTVSDLGFGIGHLDYYSGFDSDMKNIFKGKFYRIIDEVDGDLTGTEEFSASNDSMTMTVLDKSGNTLSMEDKGTSMSPKGTMVYDSNKIGYVITDDGTATISGNSVTNDFTGTVMVNGTITPNDKFSGKGITTKEYTASKVTTGALDFSLMSLGIVSFEGSKVTEIETLGLSVINKITILAPSVKMTLDKDSIKSTGLEQKIYISSNVSLSAKALSCPFAKIYYEGSSFNRDWLDVPDTSNVAIQENVTLSYFKNII